MAIKSKKYKRSGWFKTLCVVMGAVLIFCSAALTIAGVTQIIVTGKKDIFGSAGTDYYQSGYFGSEFGNAVMYVGEINSICKDIKISDEIDKNADSIKSQLLDDYLDNKASIIEAELEYAATHYSYDIENVENATVVTSPEIVSETSAVSGAGEKPSEKKQESGTQTTAATKKKYNVDFGAPPEVQQAQMALNTLSGRGFLTVENLVREEAFESSFDCTFTLPSGYVGTFIVGNSGLDEESAVRQIAEGLDYYIFDLDTNIDYPLNRLAMLDDLDYCAVSSVSGEVYSDIEKADEFTAGIKKYGAEKYFEKQKINIWFACENGNVSSKGLSCFKSDDYFNDFSILNYYPADNDENFCIWVPDCPKTQPVFAFMNRVNNGYYLGYFLVAALILLILSIVVLVVLARAAGRNENDDSVCLCFIDRLPTDIHFIVSFALLCLEVISAVVCAGLFIIDDFSIFGSIDRLVDGMSFTLLPIILAGLFSAAGYLVFAEWLCSTARIKKSGKSWFGRFIGVRIISKAVRKTIALLAYKPGNFRRNMILILSGFAVINAAVILIIIASICTDMEGFGLFLIILLLAADFYAAYKVIDYVKKLDGIISSVSENKPIDDNEKYPQSLQTLCSGLEINKEKLDAAVETALRDERMKTELITNVSHDLKTPLTSIINYVDLLSKCEIDDEVARGYIGVLDERSKRLKTLVEDLVEASKASSGNVQLNITRLNLCELVKQVAGEMSENFEKRNLDVRTDFSENEISVMADGQKTCRIIENLFSNASKYSADNSRIYVEVSAEEKMGVLTVKNISKNELNVSADELMERFVRGDKSRTDGGNGLGLSIARDLAAVQNGNVSISIDGDLFKVRLELPLSE